MRVYAWVHCIMLRWYLCSLTFILNITIFSLWWKHSIFFLLIFFVSTEYVVSHYNILFLCNSNSTTRPTCPSPSLSSSGSHVSPFSFNEIRCHFYISPVGRIGIIKLFDTSIPPKVPENMYTVYHKIDMTECPWNLSISHNST